MNDIKQNDLVTINENRQPVTTSLKIAEVFGKKHKNVMQAINNIIGDLRNLEDGGRLNFQPTSYYDVQGREQKQYIVTRDGFTLLAMGFTGKKALEFKIQYIAAFNAMEQALKSQVPVPLDAKAIGGIVKNCCAVAVREELERVATDMVYADKFKQLAKAAIADVIFSEDYYGSLKKLIKPWVKDAACESLGQSIDAYIKAEMDERVKYFVEYVFKNYPKMSQGMKEYLITYGIVNYGKFSEYSREKDFKGICDTVSRQESKDPTVRYAA
jgi:Rha family phage regulatory protein